MKKFLCTLLCVVLVFGLLPTTFAAGEQKPESEPAGQFVITPADPAQTTLHRGDRITFNVALHGTEKCDQAGLLLQYDKSVFQIKSIKCTLDCTVNGTNGDGFAVSFNTGDDPGGMDNPFKGGVLIDGPIGYFTLMVKEDCTFGEMTVTGKTAMNFGPTRYATTCNVVTLNVACQHSYGPWEKLDDTYHTKTCSICGEVVKEKHIMGDPVTVPPTCDQDGSKTWTCAVCGGVSTEVIPALGHDWEAPVYTWSEDGKTCTAQRTCKRDNYTETAQAAVTSQVTKAATCTEKGETTYTAKFTESWAVTQTTVRTDVAALGHDWDAPVYTWSEDGKTCTAERTCKRCEIAETAAATVTSEVTKAATCTEKGETTYTAEFAETWAAPQQKTVANIEMLPHTWSHEWSKNHTHHWYECTVCHTKKDEGVHQWDEGVVTKTPTCEEEGVKTFTCPICQETKTEAIPALGHDWNASVYTWSEDGKTCTAERTCKRCGNTETAQATVTGEETKAPTCTQMGETTYTAKFTQSWAQTQSTVRTDIPALGHNYEVKHDENNHWKECSVCHDKKELAPHTWDEGVVTKAPTCEEEGVKTFTCPVCQATRTEVIPALGHDWNAPVYTWSEDGKTCTAERTCKRCEITETAQATVTGEETKAPTCTEKGETTYTAKFTQSWAQTQTTVRADVPAKGHSVETQWNYDETHHWHVCSVCHEKIDYAEHAWGEGEITKAPTCKETGIKTYACACGAVKTEVLPKTEDHKFGPWEKVDDATHKRTCEVCGLVETAEHTFGGEWLTDGENHWHVCECGAVGEVAAHTPGADATCTEAQTCTICGQALKEALGHDAQKVEGKPATYTEPGNIPYYVCKTCNKLFADPECTKEITLEDTVIPALIAVTEDSVVVAEQALDDAIAQGGSQVVLDLRQFGKKSAQLPAAALDKVLAAAPDASLTLMLKDAEIRLSHEALAAICAQAEGSAVTVSVYGETREDLNEAQLAGLKNHEIAEILGISVTCDDVQITDLQGGTLDVRFLTKLENGTGYDMLHAAENGSTEKLTASVKEGTLVFATGHVGDHVLARQIELPDPDGPAQTGDSNYWIAACAGVVMVLCAAEAAVLILLKKKRA